MFGLFRLGVMRSSIFSGFGFGFKATIDSGGVDVGGVDTVRMFVLNWECCP